MKPPIISSSILAADFSCLADQIHQAETGGADWVHIDVMDGHFVPNITMGPIIVEACRKITSLPLDVHLMIEQPERFLEDFAKAGATLISVHVETCPHLYRTLQWIRELGCKAGVVLNPGTPSESLSSVLEIVDLILVMTVSPGFGGQNYIQSMNTKIHELRTGLDLLGSNVWIEVDGGISHTTLPSAYAAGARVFVAGTSIFRHPQGIAQGISELRNSIES